MSRDIKLVRNEKLIRVIAQSDNISPRATLSKMDQTPHGNTKGHLDACGEDCDVDCEWFGVPEVATGLMLGEVKDWQLEFCVL